MYFFQLLFLLAIPTQGARILAMYPVPSISHQVVFRPLMLELARRGHEVVVITTDAITQDDVPANYTQIDLHDIYYKIWREKVLVNLARTDDVVEMMKIIYEEMTEIFEHQFRSPGVQQLLRSGQHFDLVFAESHIQPAFVLSHIYKAPLILFSSLGFDYALTNVIGAPNHLFFNSDFIRKRLYNLSLIEKITVLYEDLKYKHILWKLQKVYEEKLNNLFGANAPTLKELVDNVDMLFLGVNALWDDNRPVPPSVIYTGALHMKPPRELPEELKSYLDHSKNGVIYMSFGTNVDPTLLPPERIKVFTDVFLKLPYEVLWKWNGDELPGKPKNVRISKWLPQADLLRRPNVKLFITQGGLQSADESIAAGVPLLAFPFLADQWYNAEKFEHFGIGKKMDFPSIDREGLEKAIKTMISDKKYKENMVRLRTLMRDKPDQPLERAVWWTEYVLRHKGAKHLRSPQANISWSEYLCLDVVLVLFISLIIVLLVLAYILYKMLSIQIHVLSRYSKLKVS